VDGTPLMSETMDVLRSRIGEINPHALFAEKRSVLSNVLPAASWRSRILGSRLPQDLALRALQNVGLRSCANEPISQLDEWRRRRLTVARAIVSRPDHLILREIDDGLSLPHAADILGVLRTLARTEPLSVFVSAAEPVLMYLFADRILVL
jgi:ABC-type branched-subunit amino acid transport system ATPase component